MLGAQRFTLFANFAMAANLGVKCLSTKAHKAPYFWSMVPYTIGTNRTLALDAQATAEAVAAGMGKGEVQAAQRNVLAVVSIAAPQLYAYVYEAYGANAPFVCGAVCTLLSQLPFALAQSLRVPPQRSPQYEP